MSPHPARTSYDDVPYPSHPLRQTHPDHLATLATLLACRRSESRRRG